VHSKLKEYPWDIQGASQFINISQGYLIDLLKKLIEYPRRIINAIVFTMIYFGIRIGAWDCKNRFLTIATS